VRPRLAARRGSGAERAGSHSTTGVLGGRGRGSARRGRAPSSAQYGLKHSRPGRRTFPALCCIRHSVWPALLCAPALEGPGLGGRRPPPGSCLVAPAAGLAAGWGPGCAHAGSPPLRGSPPHRRAWSGRRRAGRARERPGEGPGYGSSAAPCARLCVCVSVRSVFPHIER